MRKQAGLSDFCAENDEHGCIFRLESLSKRLWRDNDLNLSSTSSKTTSVSFLYIWDLRTINRFIVSLCRSTNPFNKEELSSILKFGAEELFKEEEDDEETQVK